jgi:hypothetical protein
VKPTSRVPNPFLVFLFVAASIAAGADRTALNAQLDIDENGQLDYGEVLLGLRHREAPDKVNLPAIHSDKKLPADIYEDKELHAKYLIFIEPRPGHHRKAPPYSLTEVDPADFGLTKLYSPELTKAEQATQRYISKFDVKLRRSKDDLDKQGGEAFDQGAIFSYARDYDSRTDQWTARGIAAFTWNLKENQEFDPYAEQREAGKSADVTMNVPPVRPPPPSVLRSLDNVFTVEFDKVSTGNGNKDEVDSLIFGEHLIFELFTGSRGPRQRDAAASGGEVSHAFLRSLSLDFAGKWATDFSFKKKLYDVELDLIPYFNIAGNGSLGHLTYPRADGGHDTLLAWRWGVALHVEAGKVEKNNGEAALMQNDRFARIGARVNVELLILPDLLKNRLTLGASYLDYAPYTADTHRSQLFRASAQYVLLFTTDLKEESASGARQGRDARATLRAEYQQGELPLVQEKDKSLLVGLGIIF